MLKRVVNKLGLIFWSVACLVVITTPNILYAQGKGTPPSCEPGTLCNPLKAKTLDAFVKSALEVARDIGFLIAVLFIVYAGFMFVTAQGNEEKLKKARYALLWALVGTGILLGAWLLATALQDTVQRL